MGSHLLTAAAAAGLGAGAGWLLAPLAALFPPYPDDHDGRVLAPRCPHCGGRVPWPWWAPLPAWLRRCGHCGAAFAGSRRPAAWSALLLAAAAAALALRFGPTPPLLAFGYLAAVAVPLAVIDARSRRLPDPLLRPAYAISLVLLALCSPDVAAMLRAVVGAAVLGGIYLLLALVSPRGSGRGDAKLAGLLGLFLGWSGPVSALVALWGWATAAAVFAVARAVAAAARSDGPGLRHRVRALRATSVPLGPFMVAAALGAVVAQRPLAALAG